MRSERFARRQPPRRRCPPALARFDNALYVAHAQYRIPAVTVVLNNSVLGVVTTEDAPFWQVRSPFAKEGPGGE